MSDHQIADHIGVSGSMVSDTRRRLIREGRLSESNRRVGKDGRTYNYPNGLTTRSERPRCDEALDQTANDAGMETLPFVCRPNTTPWAIVVRLDDLPKLIEILHNNTNLKTNELQADSTEH